MREVKFTTFVSGGVFEAFKITINDCGTRYESKTMTGLDCPEEFKGVDGVSAYKACLEFANYKRKLSTYRYDDDSKMSAVFEYIVDTEVNYADFTNNRAKTYTIQLTKIK